jgi:thymidylate kinase
VTDVRALLLTGVYGTGKSSVAAEIADLLEARGHRTRRSIWIGFAGRTSTDRITVNTRSSARTSPP